MLSSGALSSLPGTGALSRRLLELLYGAGRSNKGLVEAAFRDGAVQPTGTAITKILPPVSRFAKAGGHSARKRTVLQKLGDFFDRFFGFS